MSQQYRAQTSIKEITAAISLISLFVLQGFVSPAQAQNFNSIFENPGGSNSSNYPSNTGGSYNGGSYNGGYSTPPESDFGNYGTGGNSGGYGTNYGNTGNSGNTGSTGGANPNYTPVSTPSMWDTILEKLMGKSKSPGEFIVFPKDTPLATGASGQTDTTNRATNSTNGAANNQTSRQSLIESQNQNRANNNAANFSTGQQWGNVRSTSAMGDGNFASGGVIGQGTGARSGGATVTGTGSSFGSGSNGFTSGSNDNISGGQNMGQSSTGQTNFNQIFENGGNQDATAQRTTPSTQSTYDPKSVQANFAGINSQVQSQLTQTQNYANSARNSLNQAMSSNNSSAIQQAASEARSHANSAQAAAESASSLASTTSSPMARALANQAREQAAQAMNYADQAMAKASASY